MSAESGSSSGEALRWCLLSLAVVVVVLLTTTQAPAHDVHAFDGERHLAMAQRDRAAPLTPELEARALEPGASEHLSEEERIALLSRIPPFCWRVLTPWLASLLPFSTVVNLEVLAFVSSWLTLTLLCLLLRRYDVSRRGTALGLLLYAGSFWAVKFGFYIPTYIDFMTQPFIVGVLLAVAVRRYAALPLVVALGVLQKESLMYLVPVVLLHRAVHEGWRSRGFAGYAALSIALPLAARLAVVWSIRPLSTYASYSSVTAYLSYFERQVFVPDFWLRLLMAAMSALGVILPATLLRPKTSWAFLRSQPHHLLLLVLGLAMLWGGSDKSRIFLYVLPVLCLLVARLADPLLQRPGPLVWFWLWTTALAHVFIGLVQLEVFPAASWPLFSPIYAQWEELVPHFARTAMILAGWALFTFLVARRLRQPFASDARAEG